MPLYVVCARLLVLKVQLLIGSGVHLTPLGSQACDLRLGFCWLSFSFDVLIANSLPG